MQAVSAPIVTTQPTLPTTMHAYGFRTYGGAEVMERLELPMPTCAPDGVLIRVAAAGINPADWNLRQGRFRFFIKTLPFVPGCDVAGEVVAVGSSVTRFAPGDPVYAMLPIGSAGGHSEYVTAPENLVAPAPSRLTLAEAAATPLAALTALQALRDKAQLQSGMELMVNGASGGVGTFAVQLGKAMGARVTGVSSSRNADLVRSLGADAVRDYTREDVTASTHQYDVVFDTVNTGGIGRWRRALKRGGILISVNPVGGNPLAKLQAWLYGRRVDSLLVKPGHADLETINRYIAAGQLRPVIDRSYPIAEVADAHRYSETSRARGKLVLIVDEALAEQRA